MEVLEVFNWKNVHITGVDTFRGELERLRRGLPIGDGRIVDWDFTHINKHIRTLLKDNVGADVYIYGSAQMAYDTSREGAQPIYAPIMHIITLQSGCVPTSTVRVKVGDQPEVFSTFEDMYYRWVRVDDPCFNGGRVSRTSGGRVYHLVLDPNAVGTAETGEDDKGASLYLMSSKEAEKDTEGQLKVDHIEFAFSDSEGEEVTEEWSNLNEAGNEEGLRELSERTVQEYCSHSTQEEQINARTVIEKVSTYVYSCYNFAMFIR